MNAIINIKNLLNLGKKAPHGGVHPPENKLLSTQLPIGTLSLPDLLTIPLRQHVGNIPKTKLNVGDKVLKGQLLAEAEGMVSAAIHAPTSGIIQAIEEAIIPHPSGLPDLCIILKPDGEDKWIAKQSQKWQQASRPHLIESMRLSGIVGLGGATFPTQIKLRSNGTTGIDTLVINAAECEPYITCDDMLMRERAKEIVSGIEIARYILDANTVIIGIEDNKPEAIDAMKYAITGKDIKLTVVPTVYPSGDARRLTYLVTGKEIPHNKRSTEVGIQVFNVGTVYALSRYFNHGEPVISRIVSMTGNVEKPQNFEVLLGTPISHVARATGLIEPYTTHYIMGGPMMGFNLPNIDVPITKAANCIIAASNNLFETPPQPMPCIRCARCADACPVSLQPQELYWFAKSDNFEKSREYNLFDCIECGACSYVCPSNIPLVQYYRYAKSEIISEDKAKEAANIARERNEARLARIEREKLERAQKHAERAQQAKTEPTLKTSIDEPSIKPANNAADDAKKAAIAAALARAKAQKEATPPKNTNIENAHIKKEIAEIDARRKKVGIEPTPNKDADINADKQAKIAEAIARAKAAKEKAGNNTDQLKETNKPKNVTDNQDKQFKIAEAVARAKAAKAQAANQQALASNSKQTAQEPTSDSEKKAKIAAAIERAKAAKAAALAQNQQNLTKTKD